MFPPGWPGLALLLLRGSVATAVLLEGYSHRLGLPGWMLGALAVLSACLCAGFLTPIMAVLALSVHVLVWSNLGIDAAGMTAIALLDALALTLLGPGAYSIDAYRFGRRVVVLPPP
jgi:putative oxidoreductase